MTGAEMGAEPVMMRRHRSRPSFTATCTMPKVNLRLLWCEWSGAYAEAVAHC
jgi:hypothetical protein